MASKAEELRTRAAKKAQRARGATPHEGGEQGAADFYTERYTHPYGERAMEERLGRGIDYAGGTGRDLTGIYSEGIKEDPRAAFRESTGAAIDEFKDRFGSDLRSLRHSQVGAGRVDTGFGFGDEDILFRTLSKDLTRTLADRSLDAEALNQQRLRDVGGIGLEYNRDALDAASGTWATRRQQRMQNRASERGFWGGLLGTAGTVAAGPLGGWLGSKLGQQAG